MGNITDIMNNFFDKDFCEKICLEKDCEKNHSEQNLIKFCSRCGHNIFFEIVVDSVDHIICEKKIICKNCDLMVNYWFYGHYENDITDEYKKILRRKKIERII